MCILILREMKNLSAILAAILGFSLQTRCDSSDDWLFRKVIGGYLSGFSEETDLLKLYSSVGF